MSKSKVVLRVSTLRAKAGDTIEVDAEQADLLVAERKATRVAGSPKKKADAEQASG